MVKHGQGEDILFRDAGVPVCARRFLALASRGGDDDMFSSDFTDQDFKVTLDHLACAVWVGFVDASVHVH